LTFSIPATVQRPEGGQLVQAQVVGALLEAQAAGQAHHADAQRAGEVGIGTLRGHLFSLGH